MSKSTRLPELPKSDKYYVFNSIPGYANGIYIIDDTDSIAPKWVNVLSDEYELIKFKLWDNKYNEDEDIYIIKSDGIISKNTYHHRYGDNEYFTLNPIFKFNPTSKIIFAASGEVPTIWLKRKINKPDHLRDGKSYYQNPLTKEKVWNRPEGNIAVVKKGGSSNKTEKQFSKIGKRKMTKSTKNKPKSRFYKKRTIRKR